MKALVASDDGVDLETCTVPSPAAGEVVVKVQCAGLCRTDLEIAAGRQQAHLPRVLGHEGAGVICRLGDGVDQARLGERVSVFPWIGCGACEYCRQDTEHLGYLCPRRRFLGRDLDGCFAEFMAVPAHRCIALEETISFQAGAYLEPVVAALGVTRAPLREAKNVALVGGNRIAGLTSLLLHEYSQLEHKQIFLGEHYENEFDLVIETEATPATIEFALHCLRPDGVLVLKSRPSGPVEWPVRMQVEKEITVMAFSYGSLLLAKRLLAKKSEMFRGLWRTPVPLSEWKREFENGWAGLEDKKVFFLPQEH